MIRLRKARELSYGQLAYKSGVSKPYLHNIEQGKVLPPKDKYIEKIAQALGVEPTYFREYRRRRIMEQLEADPEFEDAVFDFSRNAERHKELIGRKIQ